MDEQTLYLMRELNKTLDEMRGLIRQLTGDREADKEYLTTDQVADRLKIHKQTVLKMIGEGLPCYEYGKSLSFVWSEVDTFIHTHYRTGRVIEQWQGPQSRRAS